MQPVERRTSGRILIALLLSLFVAAPPRLPAQSPEQQPASGDEVTQQVARICYLNGSVSYARGDDPDTWQEADYNVPMTVGDRLYTGDDGRAELEIHGGFALRVGAQADLEAINLTDDTKQWSLRAGYAAFQVKRLGDNEVFEVDTPNSAVTFERPGQYRVDVDNDGNTRVAVKSGRALVAAGGGQVPVGGGQQMNIEGGESPQYDVVGMQAPDSFDGWVSERERRYAGAKSNQYIQADVVGAADLDEAGRWQNVPSYGMVWTPNGVEAGWQPYRSGHWIWQDPWGWTWLASERWGWAPYHYGRWITWSNRWWWVPVARSVRVVHYSPALVAFCGGGPGWSVAATAPGGYIGWFPLAPRDPFVHWWGPRRSYSAANVTYVNHGYITVVNHTTFVSGGLVTTGWVRDRAIVTSVSAAPVLRGPIPFVPQAGAMRVSVRTGQPSAMQPPRAVAARTVVVRTAPPPPPAMFRAKVDVIEKNHGAPVDRRAAATIVEADRGAGRPGSYRPAMAEPGRVTLAPRGGAGNQSPKPEPVSTSWRGRPAATNQSTSTGPGPATGTTTTGRGRPSDTGQQNRGTGNLPPTPVPPPKAKDGTYDRSRPTDNQTPQRQATPPPQRQATPPPDRGHKRDKDTSTPQGQPTPQRQATPPPDRNNQGNRDTGTPKSKPTPQPDHGKGRDVTRPTPAPRPTPSSQTTKQTEPAQRAPVQRAEPPDRGHPQTVTPQGQQGQGQGQGQGQHGGGQTSDHGHEKAKEKPAEKQKTPTDKEKEKDKKQ